MTLKTVLLACIVLFQAISASAQIDEIKRAGSSGRRGGEGSSGSFVVDFVFQFMLGEVIYQQQRKLGQKHEIPDLVSLEVMAHGAAQPSSYYILNPRVRGNWGLFSTDFRINYILEEGIDGVKHIRTNDWQMLQLNFITTRNVTARVGGGMMYEAYGERVAYPEWTGGVHVKPLGAKLSGVAEYRHSEARSEVNGHVRYALFSRRTLHGYFTAGMVFQRYYREVNVWGFQGGLALSVF